MQALAIKQPLDDHMVTHFPGVLLAITYNSLVCFDTVHVPELRR
jgi:hypothetical protein